MVFATMTDCQVYDSFPSSLCPLSESLAASVRFLVGFPNPSRGHPFLTHALISVVTVIVAAAAAARAKLILLLLRLRGSMCTEEAGKDGVGPKQGATKWGATPIHAGGGVSTGLQKKLQYAGCLGFHRQVQRGPATRGFLWEVPEQSVRAKGGQCLPPHWPTTVAHRFIEVSSSIPEQLDHLGIFVDDSYMEWGMAWGQMTS